MKSIHFSTTRVKFSGIRKTQPLKMTHFLRAPESRVLLYKLSWKINWMEPWISLEVTHCERSDNVGGPTWERVSHLPGLHLRFSSKAAVMDGKEYSADNVQFQIITEADQ